MKITVTTHNTKSPLIIALDFDSRQKAIDMARILAPSGVRFKVGMELYYACGPTIVEDIKKHGEVFLDLKLHDIPNTMSQAALVLTKLGVWMFNVHASAGAEALRRVRDDVKNLCTKDNLPQPKITGVTVLTSLEDLSHLGVQKPADHTVLDLALLSASAGLDGIVCSARDLKFIHPVLSKTHPDFLYVTPGIRSPSAPADDQKRTATPQEGMDLGATHLVVGRPVTGAKNPLKEVRDITSFLAMRPISS